MKKLVRSAIKRGWQDVADPHKGNVHYVLQWTDGTILRASFSPSCHHAVKNCAADMKRIERNT
jgi:hypothetical protein